MSLTIITLLLFGLGLVAFTVARGRAAAFPGAGGGVAASARPHSRPNYHGAFVALMALAPALLVVAAWGLASDRVVGDVVIASVPAADRPSTPLDRSSFLSDVQGIASGDMEAGFNPATGPAAKIYTDTHSSYNLIAGGVAAVLLAIGAM